MILRWLFALTNYLQSSQDYWNIYLVANPSFSVIYLVCLSLDKHSSAIGGKKRWRNQDKIKLLLGRLHSMHWIFQCMVGHVHRIYLWSIPCTTRIPRSPSHIGFNPSNLPTHY